jgi:hypothetical protein
MSHWQVQMALSVGPGEKRALNVCPARAVIATGWLVGLDEGESQE